MGRPSSNTVNGSTADLPSREEISKWPGLNEAARLLGCSHNQIYKLVKDGAVQACSGDDGRPRYNPAHLNESRGMFEEEKPPEPRGLTPEDFKAGNELVKLVHSHHSTMVPLLVDGYRSMITAAEGRIKAMAEELGIARARITELEKERDANAAAREKMLTEEHARLIAEKSFEAAERRKDKAFSVVTDRLAPILMQKLGVASDPKMQAGMALLQTIKREQILALLFTGMLEPEQAKLARKLVEPLTDEEKKALGETGASSPQGESSPAPSGVQPKDKT